MAIITSVLDSLVGWIFEEVDLALEPRYPGKAQTLPRLRSRIITIPYAVDPSLAKGLFDLLVFA